MMRNEVKELVEKIKSMALVTIPGQVNGDNAPLNLDEYMKNCRIPLNVLLIGFALGGNCDQDKDGKGTIKFNRKLPTHEQLSEVIDILNTFITTVEVPFLETKNITVTNDPPEGFENFGGNNNTVVPNIDKINNKNVRGCAFGNDVAKGVAMELLNSTDMQHLVAMGERLRKKKIRNIALITTATAVVVTAGIVAYVIIDKKNHDDSHNPIIDIDDDDDIMNDDINDDPVIVDIDDEFTVKAI